VNGCGPCISTPTSMRSSTNAPAHGLGAADNPAVRRLLYLGQCWHSSRGGGVKWHGWPSGSQATWPVIWEETLTIKLTRITFYQGDMPMPARSSGLDIEARFTTRSLGYLSWIGRPRYPWLCREQASQRTGNAGRPLSTPTSRCRTAMLAPKAAKWRSHLVQVTRT